jgi:hypothetical protein
MAHFMMSGVCVPTDWMHVAHIYRRHQIYEWQPFEQQFYCRLCWQHVPNSSHLASIKHQRRVESLVHGGPIQDPPGHPLVQWQQEPPEQQPPPVGIQQRLGHLRSTPPFAQAAVHVQPPTYAMEPPPYQPLQPSGHAPPPQQPVLPSQPAAGYAHMGQQPEATPLPHAEHSLPEVSPQRDDYYFDPWSGDSLSERGGPSAPAAPAPRPPARTAFEVEVAERLGRLRARMDDLLAAQARLENLVCAAEQALTPRQPRR